MTRAIVDGRLDELLASVSRSFYFSLAVLPGAVRRQLSVAYLLGRAADTIADSPMVKPERRLSLLHGLRRALLDEEAGRTLSDALGREVAEGRPPGRGEQAERLLLLRIGDCLKELRREEEADRLRTAALVETLIVGMERDLSRFPDERRLCALSSMEELDEHTWNAAGCVGRFWTEMTAAHLPALAHLREPRLVERAVRLGKALQLVNLIRDAPADLALGRCYLPRPLLACHGIEPHDLIAPTGNTIRRGRMALAEMSALALAHIDAAWPYVLAIPARAVRLRLSSVWPLWIGLATLEAVARAENPLSPRPRIKVSRQQLYVLMAESVATVAITPLLEECHRWRRARAGRAVTEQ